MSAKDIRAWARANGLDVPARGTVPSHIVSAYRFAHGDDTPVVIPQPEPADAAALTFEVPGTCRFTIDGTEYEVPMSIPVTWTPGGAA